MSIQDKIIMEFELDKVDYQEFNIYHSWDSVNRRGFRIRTKIFGALFVFLILFLIVYLDKCSITLADIIKLIIFTVIVYLITLAFGDGNQRSRIRKKADKFLAKTENRNFLKRNRFEFDENGFLVRSDISESYNKWDCITKIDKGDKYFLLYTSLINAIIIPKRVIDEKDIAAFERLIEKIK